MSTIQYRPLLGVAFGALALGCIVGATPALANGGRAAAPLCYLWANNPSPALNTPYQPSPDYSFNAVDGPTGSASPKSPPARMRSHALASAAALSSARVATCRSRLMEPA
jgi:hypothetical protein